MIISNSKKFIFIHIHKTGGSSVSIALQPHLAWNDLTLGGSPFGEAINSPYSQQFGLSKHSTLEEIQSVCGSDLVQEYFSFALVRHPCTRVVSLYNYIANLSEELARFCGKSEAELAAESIVGTNSIEHNFLDWTVTRAFYQTKTFGEFIRSPEAQSDMGFRPQIDSLRTIDGKYRVKKIVKLEELAGKLPEIWEELGFRFYPPHSNQSKSYFQKPDALSLADSKYLKKLFADDFLALEY